MGSWLKGSIATVDYTKVIESLVCITQGQWPGFDTFFDSKAFSLAIEEFKDKDSKFTRYAAEFQKDINQLHPLAKLKGIRANKESRSRLPEIESTTEAFAEDLKFAIDEILSPSEDIAKC